MLHVPNGRERPKVKYALLAMAQRGHCMPIATGGDKRCGLRTYPKAKAFLESFGIAITEQPGGLIDVDAEE